MIRIEINELPRLQTNTYSNWRIRHGYTKLWHRRVGEALIHFQAKIESPLKRSKILCIRRSLKEPDYDNLVISFKPIIDGLKVYGVIEDDKTSNVMITYIWQKVKKRIDQKVIIEIGPL